MASEPSASDNTESCGECRYFLAKTPGDPVGVCRRSPPNRQRPSAPWPGVQATEWCGEFKSGPAPNTMPSPYNFA